MSYSHLYSHYPHLYPLFQKFLIKVKEICIKCCYCIHFMSTDLTIVTFCFRRADVPVPVNKPSGLCDGALLEHCDAALCAAHSPANHRRHQDQR